MARSNSPTSLELLAKSEHPRLQVVLARIDPGNVETVPDEVYRTLIL